MSLLSNKKDEKLCRPSCHPLGKVRVLAKARRGSLWVNLLDLDSDPVPKHLPSDTSKSPLW